MSHASSSSALDVHAGLLERLHGGIIVSSQVMDPRSPLDDPETLARLAQTAVLGGAAGARVASAETVAALRRREPDLPIIGITKRFRDGLDNYITPSSADATALLEAGADIIAVQATRGSRLDESFADIAAVVHAHEGLVMADISTTDEAVNAVAAGADLVATTMFGFTPATTDGDRPAIELASDLTASVSVPVILEGSVWGPDDVTAAFTAGVLAVVAGSAVTAPERIMARLVASSPRASETTAEGQTASTWNSTMDGVE